MCFYCYRSLFMFSVLCCCMCLFDCKCKSLNQLGENMTIKNRKKQKYNRKASRKTKKHRTKQKYIISQPEPEIYLFAEVRGLDILYLLLLFCLCLSRSLSVLCMFISVKYCMFYVLCLFVCFMLYVVCVVFMFYVYVCCAMFYVYLFCFMCSPSLFNCCLNTTQYTTLNTSKLEMGLFMTCVTCSK